MRYKLMNDYSAAWPFWGGKEGAGLCAEDDPALPDDVAVAARVWAAQFNELFDYQHGWPNQVAALAHEAEGERLFGAVRRALPADEVTFHYWERAFRRSQ